MRLPRKTKKKLKKSFGNDSYNLWVSRKGHSEEIRNLLINWDGVLNKTSYGDLDHKAKNIAQLLENQEKEMLQEVNEEPNIFDLAMFPIVRNVIATTIGFDLT